MPKVYAIDGIVPVVEPGAFVHPSAVLIGMNCVINDNAEVGEDAVVAALAFVKAEARIPARALAAGVPARVLRELSEEEIRWKREEALTRVDPSRARFDIPGSVPLSEMKRTHG